MPLIEFAAIDAAVHGPVRLGVLVSLETEGRLDFSGLKERLKITDGALGLHLQRLEDTGYLVSRKAFVRRKPRTTYRITGAGKRALRRYLRTMKRVIDAVGVES